MKTKLIVLILLLTSLQTIATNPSDNFWSKKWITHTQSNDATITNYQLSLHNYNWNYKNRRQLNEAAQSYLKELENQDAFYIDPELEDYLYQLIYQIHPETFPKHQRTNLNVKIIKSIIPESFSLVNGTIIISTGMLSLLQSEDELMALLTKEIAHIVLDHNVRTYTAIKTKQTISSIIGAGAYIAATAISIDNGDDFWEADYLGSAVGIGATWLSHGILSALGVGHNKSMLYDADEIAQDWMIENKRNPYALLQVFRRLQYFDIAHRGTYQTINDKRVFFNLRFNKIVKNKKYKLNSSETKLVPLHIDYDTHMSNCLMINSKMLIANETYAEAVPYLNRSIKSNWPLGESYLLKAIAYRHIKYSKTDNKEILSLLDKAEVNAVTELPWVWSEKALIHIRLHENQFALNAFVEFEKFFNNRNIEIPIWAQKMVHKLEKVNSL